MGRDRLHDDDVPLDELGGGTHGGHDSRELETLAVHRTLSQRLSVRLRRKVVMRTRKETDGNKKAKVYYGGSGGNWKGGRGKDIFGT